MANTFGGIARLRQAAPESPTWENLIVEYQLGCGFTLCQCRQSGRPGIRPVRHRGTGQVDGRRHRYRSGRGEAGTDRHESDAGRCLDDGKYVRDVRWNGSIYDGAVDLLFSVDGGVNRSVLAEALPNTGSYLWKLPAAVDSNACVVYAVPHVADANVLQVDSGPFAIHPDSARPAVASKWPSLGGNSQRTGLSEYQGPDAGQVKWKFDAAGAVVASVTVGFDGRVHVACEDGRLHTLDAEGRLLWTCEMDSAAVSSPTIGPDGSLFVGSERGTLYAIDINGKTRWTYRTGGPIYSSPAVAPDGSVFVGSADGTLYALTDGGSERWRFQTKGPGIRPTGAIFASPSLGTDGAVYVAGLYDPNLYALDAHDGSVRWVCRFGVPGGRIFASPVVAKDGTIYQALLRDTHLYAIEPKAGGIVWSADLVGPDIAALAGPDVRLNGEAWSEPVLGPDGTIYVSTGDPYLRAIRPDGRVKWMKRLGETGGFTLTVDKRGFVYAAAEDGVVYTVSPEGVETGRLALSGLPGFPVVVADDLLIVADSRDYSLLVADEQNTIWAISSKAEEDKP